jgi:hypothetical protein
LYLEKSFKPNYLLLKMQACIAKEQEFEECIKRKPPLRFAHGGGSLVNGGGHFDGIWHGFVHGGHSRDYTIQAETVQLAQMVGRYFVCAGVVSDGGSYCVENPKVPSTLGT